MVLVRKGWGLAGIALIALVSTCKTNTISSGEDKCQGALQHCTDDPNVDCETNTDVRPDHCGACGKRCASVNGTAACVAGQCTFQCTAGFGDCNGDGADGCETALATTVAHCGA